MKMILVTKLMTGNNISISFMTLELHFVIYFHLHALFQNLIPIFSHFSHWTVTVEDDTTCSISTHAIASTDIGEWNCELQSFPNAEVTDNVKL